jgi:hypothetical protein
MTTDPIVIKVAEATPASVLLAVVVFWITFFVRWSGISVWKQLGRK